MQVFPFLCACTAPVSGDYSEKHSSLQHNKIRIIFALVFSGKGNKRSMSLHENSLGALHIFKILLMDIFRFLVHDWLRCTNEMQVIPVLFVMNMLRKEYLP